MPFLIMQIHKKIRILKMDNSNLIGSCLILLTTFYYFFVFTQVGVLLIWQRGELLLQVFKEDLFHCTIHIFRYILLNWSWSVISPLYNNLHVFFNVNLLFSFNACWDVLAGVDPCFYLCIDLWVEKKNRKKNNFCWTYKIKFWYFIWCVQ